MAYGNKMGSYGGGKKGGNAKGFKTVQYEDRGAPKGEQYWGSKYGTGSARGFHGHTPYTYKGRY